MQTGAAVVILAASLVAAACQRGGDEPKPGDEPGSGAEPSASAAVAGADTPPATGSAEDAIRAFVGALRARDLGTAKSMLITAETCAELAPQRVEQCKGVVPELHAGIGELLAVVDTSYAIGSIEEAEKAPAGIRLFEVTPEGGDRDRTLLLVVAEHDGRHRFAWPIKVEVESDATPSTAVPREGIRETTDHNQLDTPPPAVPSSSSQVP